MSTRSASSTGSISSRLRSPSKYAPTRPSIRSVRASGGRTRPGARPGQRQAALAPRNGRDLPHRSRPRAPPIDADDGVVPTVDGGDLYRPVGGEHGETIRRHTLDVTKRLYFLTRLFRKSITEGGRTSSLTIVRSNSEDQRPPATRSRLIQPIPHFHRRQDPNSATHEQSCGERLTGLNQRLASAGRTQSLPH